jgi:hypothetical protein
LVHGLISFSAGPIVVLRRSSSICRRLNCIELAQLSYSCRSL